MSVVDDGVSVGTDVGDEQRSPVLKDKELSPRTDWNYKILFKRLEVSSKTEDLSLKTPLRTPVVEWYSKWVPVVHLLTPSVRSGIKTQVKVRREDGKTEVNELKLKYNQFTIRSIIRQTLTKDLISSHITYDSLKTTSLNYVAIF